MRIEKTAPGRSHDMGKDGVGTLKISGAKDYEAKWLAIIAEEFSSGNLGYWALMMWAVSEKKITKLEKSMLQKIYIRLHKEFE